MKENTALVLTSIAKPNAVLRQWAEGCRENGFRFIIIGDESSPPEFELEGCRFYSLEEQRQLEFEFSAICPTRHYARKNIGYLVAASSGASLIVETDDDNIPYREFWQQRRRHQTVRTIADHGWVNVYRYFSEANIWPRGLPLDRINSPLPPFESLVAQTEVNCPIQQGLADQNPDVDAIYRLLLPLPQSFRKDRRVALTAGSWCPFNSQNTTWWPDAFPLLYLPAYCSFRMTDIWRSFVAGRIARANDWGVLFHEPTVWQERNEHDLMRDFKDEIPGYLHNSTICEALDQLRLKPGVENTGENLRACYEKLVQMDLIDRRELQLIEAWISDIYRIIQRA